MRFSSETWMLFGWASCSHPATDVHMSNRPRSAGIDLSGPAVSHAFREPSTHFRSKKNIQKIWKKKLIFLFYNDWRFISNSNRDRLDLQCPSKSISSRACVHFWCSSIRNRVADKVPASYASSSLFSIHDRCTVSNKADHWPAYKCSKMWPISKSFAAAVTEQSAGS